MRLTVEQVERLLRGKAVTVSVGEPWDFESPDGQNVLKGRITTVWREGEDLEDSSADRVRIEVTPFETRSSRGGEAGREVGRLTAHRRYVEEEGIIQQIASGRDADVNLHYGDQVAEEDLPPGASPFLIGGVRLEEA